jgi:ABC-type sugar transport system ATPase subunit
MESSMTEATPILSVEAVTKRYAGVVALDEASLQIERGEIRAVLGKNGAGKSTLVNLLSGAVQPDAGRILLDGTPARIASPRDALKRGIVTVHQELTIVPGLSVADNVMLGRWGRWGLAADRDVQRQARQALARLHSGLDPRQPAAHLSIANWQTIEIARALTQDVRVLILDEPTSALPPPDADLLIANIRSLAADGVTVIYVTHRLDEIPRVADRVTVFRDGSVVGTVDSKTSTRQLVSLMVGAARPEAVAVSRRQNADPAPSQVLLRVENLRVPNRLFGIDLELRRGEVLGLAGLVGAGATEVLRAIFGLLPDATGSVSVEGRPIGRRTPVRMRHEGVALAPDDRKREGLFLRLSVADNIGFGSAARISSYSVIRPGRLADLAREAIAKLGIVTSGLEQRVQYLSGGNQQKVVIARCLAGGVRVLLLDEPTRGVDVEAKIQIYQLLRGLATEGLGVIVAPSEFDEFVYLCDRVIVLREGRIVSELTPPDITAERVMTLAIGAGEEETAGQRQGAAGANSTARKG